MTYHERFDLITPEELTQVKDALNIISGNPISPPRESVQLLFDVFCKYIDKSMNDIHCGSCRAHIYKYFQDALR